MALKPIELRRLYPEDRETTPFYKWNLRLFAILVIVYSVWIFQNYADSFVEQLFFGSATLFFGLVSWWGLLFMCSDPAGTNRREQIRSQPLRSIDCPACDTTVGAAHVDCPECGSTLRD